jgi:hypothetical protein
MMKSSYFGRVIAIAGLLAAGGCTAQPPPPVQQNQTSGSVDPTKESAEAEIAAERAKLSPDDRALVEAQEWCVVMTDERLGSMGPPIKLTIKGQPVFICCRGCRRKAEANPDQTLAKLEELKAKKSGK